MASYDTWGGSWGITWGGSWGAGDTPVGPPLGGKGDNGKDARKRHTIKPDGGINKKALSAKPTVDDRAKQSAEIAAEVAENARQQFIEGRTNTALADAMLRAQLLLRDRVEMEIDARVFDDELRRKDDEEIMAILLMIAAST